MAEKGIGNPKYIKIRIQRRSKKGNIHQTHVYKLKEKGFNVKTYFSDKGYQYIEFSLNPKKDEAYQNFSKWFLDLFGKPDNEISDPENIHFLEFINTTPEENVGVRLSFHFINERLEERIGIKSKENKKMFLLQSIIVFNYLLNQAIKQGLLKKYGDYALLMPLQGRPVKILISYGEPEKDGYSFYTIKTVLTEDQNVIKDVEEILFYKDEEQLNQNFQNSKILKNGKIYNLKTSKLLKKFQA